MSDTSWTTDDIPDQSGRVAIVTGANTGPGLEPARALAGKGAGVVLAVRNLDKGKAAVDDIRSSVPDADLELQELDLASLDSIRAAAEDVRGRYDRIDLLLNNAGVYLNPGDSYGTGGTNHMRMNLGTSRGMISHAIERMADAVQRI